MLTQSESWGELGVLSLFYVPPPPIPGPSPQAWLQFGTTRHLLLLAFRAHRMNSVHQQEITDMKYHAHTPRQH